METDLKSRINAVNVSDWFWYRLNRDGLKGRKRLFLLLLLLLLLFLLELLLENTQIELPQRLTLKSFSECFVSIFDPGNGVGILHGWNSYTSPVSVGLQLQLVSG